MSTVPDAVPPCSSELELPVDLAIDTTHLYWVDRGPNTVWRRPLSATPNAGH